MACIIPLYAKRMKFLVNSQFCNKLLQNCPGAIHGAYQQAQDGKRASLVRLANHKAWLVSCHLTLSEYALTRAIPEELKTSLPSVEDIEKELDTDKQE